MGNVRKDQQRNVFHQDLGLFPHIIVWLLLLRLFFMYIGLVQFGVSYWCKALWVIRYWSNTCPKSWHLLTLYNSLLWEDLRKTDDGFPIFLLQFAASASCSWLTGVDPDVLLSLILFTFGLVELFWDAFLLTTVATSGYLSYHNLSVSLSSTNNTTMITEIIICPFWSLIFTLPEALHLELPDFMHCAADPWLAAWITQTCVPGTPGSRGDLDKSEKCLEIIMEHNKHKKSPKMCTSSVGS